MINKAEDEEEEDQEEDKVYQRIHLPLNHESDEEEGLDDEPIERRKAFEGGGQFGRSPLM